MVVSYVLRELTETGCHSLLDSGVVGVGVGQAVCGDMNITRVKFMALRQKIGDSLFHLLSNVSMNILPHVDTYTGSTGASQWQWLASEQTGPGLVQRGACERAGEARQARQGRESGRGREALCSGPAPARPSLITANSSIA